MRRVQISQKSEIKLDSNTIRQIEADHHDFMIQKAYIAPVVDGNVKTRQEVNYICEQLAHVARRRDPVNMTGIVHVPMRCSGDEFFCWVEGHYAT